MKLTVVGSSPAWPNPGGAHSGYLLSAGGDSVLLDCGGGVLARLRRDEPWPFVDAVVISHMHLDHCGDLVAWLWLHFSGPAAGTPGPDLWLPAGGRKRLGDLAQPAQWEAVFPLHEYEENVPFDAAGFRIVPRRVVHYDEPTWGLRVERDGHVLAYSADTALTPALVELAAGADVFLCEATLLEADDGARGHMTAEDARSAFRDAGAARLLITHRSVENSLDELVHDGLELDLGS